MTRSLDQANDEIGAVGRLPYGTARTLAAEQQVRLVDAEGPDEARAYALYTLVDSMVWGGEVQRAYLPFTRLVRWLDEHPEHFDEHDRSATYWSFKWMVGDLMKFPEVPAEQIEATLEDMERRYAVAGLGRDAVAAERFGWAAHRDAPDTVALYDEWVRTPRDEFSQCVVCDPGDRAAYLFDAGRTDEAVRLVEEVLAEGETCATEPATMLSYLALAYLDAGRTADAARAYRRLVAALAESRSDMASSRGRRFVLLARGGRTAEALRALGEDHRLLTAADTPLGRLAFLVSVVAGTAALLPDEGGRPVDAGDAPAATVAELHAWADREATALAAAFDRRNGTTAMADQLAAARATRRCAHALDLDVLPRVAAAPAAPSSGPAADLPDASESPQDLLATAESLLASGDLEEAAGAFAAAAAAAQEEGWLDRAGLALAEAARCAQVLGDEAGAAGAYARGVALARAGGVLAADLVPVVVAWAPAAVTQPSGADGGPTALLAAVDALRAGLEAAGDTADDEPPAPEDQALARRLTAELDDTAARVLASLGGTDLPRAASLAGAAAEAYAQVGAVGDAAHAFWLAGRLHADLGDDEQAVWNLESAVEGFALARAAEPRSAAADELVAVLRRTGQDARAEAVVRALTD